MLPLVNDPYETLRPYVPGKPVLETERELGIEGGLTLASNENPFGPSPRAMEAVRGALAELHDYPDGSAYYFRQRLAAVHNVDAEQIVVGGGTSELIELIVRTFLRPEENLVNAQPSFIMYRLAAQAAGRQIRDVPLRDMRYDLPAMAAAMDARTKLVFIANPNNPTGTYVTRDEMARFFEAIADDVLVVLDEAYCHYVDARDYPDGREYLGRRERLLVLRTFSKAYGLAGLRVGYGVGSRTLIDYLNRGRQPFNTGSLAQVGALAAIDDAAHVARSRVSNTQQRARLTGELRRLGLDVVESQANFVLVDFHVDAQSIYERLLRQGVIVRPMASYGLAHSARITVGTAPQNDKLLASLRRVLE